MIILDHHRTVIITPPKTGSTSLHEWAKTVGYRIHPDQHATKLAHVEDYRVIGVVRDPVSRAASLFWHFSQGVRRRVAAQFYASIRDIPDVAPRPLRESCIRWLEHRQDIDEFFRLTCTQWVAKCGRRVDGWIRTEYLLDDIKRRGLYEGIVEPKRLNASKRPWFGFGDDQREWIRRRYAPDDQRTWSKIDGNAQSDA